TTLPVDLELADDTYDMSAGIIVRGVELPRLVINEVATYYYWDLAGIDANSTDLWTLIELRNPVPDSPGGDSIVGLATDVGRLHSRSLQENYRIHIRAKVGSDVVERIHDFDPGNSAGGLEIGEN